VSFLNNYFVVQAYSLGDNPSSWIDIHSPIQVISGEPFKSQDYMAVTPSWAVYGAEEGGFDPDQSRFKKERRHGTAALKGWSSWEDMGLLLPKTDLCYFFVDARISEARILECWASKVVYFCLSFSWCSDDGANLRFLKTSEHRSCWRMSLLYGTAGGLACWCVGPIAVEPACMLVRESPSMQHSAA
jgi:hypothetical protein